MKQINQLRIALEIMASWSRKEPLHSHLTNEFRKHKEFGSRDRRLYASLAYSSFRIGRLAEDKSPEFRIAIASFLCNDEDNKIRTFLVEQYLPEALPLLEHELESRLNFIDKHIDKIDHIFPVSQTLSEGLTKGEFIRSMLNRPFVFIRISEGKADEVDQELSQLYVNPGNIDLPLNTRALKPGARLDDSFAVNKNFIEIQDLSSQLTASHMNPENPAICWDACAGSGGKSLMLLGKYPALFIHASDVRKSILQNYSNRLTKHHYTSFKTYVIDLETDTLSLPQTDFIVADVPCTGSGTWARSPEQACIFDQNTLDHYILKQDKIIRNIIASGQKGQTLFYVTCSIFRAENEDQIEKFEKQGLVTIRKQLMIRGAAHKADSMFIAELEIN